MTHSEQMEFTNHHNPFLQHCGITAQELDEQHALLTAPFTPQCTNTVGTVHGGMLYTLADCCSGLTARTDGRKYVTQNGSLNYLSNVAQGHLEAESRVIRRGRTVCVLDIAVRCPEENKLLAEGIFTMYAI